MKKLLLALMLLMPLIVLSQSKSPTIEKVKSGVKKSLYLTMKDYSSYKPVQWGKLETIYSNYLTTDRANYLLDSIKSIREPADFYFEAMKARREVEGIDLETDSIYQSYKKEAEPIANKMKPLIALFEKEEALFKKKIIGYSIYHSYRGKNSYGAYTIDSDTFTLNTMFKVISTASEEEEEEEN